MAGVAHRFIQLPDDLSPDVAAHVAFHGIGMKQAVPTLLFHTEKGFIAAQRRADTRLDMKKLKALAGVDRLRMATEEELTSFHTVPGDVPLTGFDIPYYIDEKVLELHEIYGGGGMRSFALVITPSDLVRINSAVIGDFSESGSTADVLTGRKRILSGITPSGDGALHIGNYLGAVKQFIELAKQHECFLMVADLHALTTVQHKETLEHNIETLILNELALLGDLKNIVFFRQSDVLQHAELTWILNNMTPLGLIKRAHAYKDKLAKNAGEDDVNMGLFCYPVLMAADILLYSADLVPVGKDQKQHVEITRDIAERFNKTYPTSPRLRGASKTGLLKLPDPYIPEDVAVVLGTDGKRKMSKSLGNIISIFEDEAVIKKQVAGTYTDPARIRATDPGHIEGNMVFFYLDFFAPKDQVEQIKEQYRQGKISDVTVKEVLFQALMKHFAPARERYRELKANPEKVRRILEDGAQRCRQEAGSLMENVRQAIGMTTTYSFFRY